MSSAQWNSVLAQRESIQRQMDSVASQRGSAQVQVVSAARQRGSVQKQMELVPSWKVEVPAGLPATDVVSEPAAMLDCPSLSRQEADSLVETAAKREALPPDLLRAVIKQESGFHPCAISGAGAQGLMQLMPATAVDLHVNNPFDPNENVRAGASYLKQLVTRYGGDLRRALSAYNAGMGRVDLVDGVPAIPETENYVSAITGQLGYEQLGYEQLGYQQLEQVPVVAPPQAGSIRPVTLHLTLGTVQLGGDGVAVQLKP